MKTLGFAVLFLGWVVELVAVFDLAHDWVQTWFTPDPAREKRMNWIYIGGMRRVR